MSETAKKKSLSAMATDLERAQRALRTALDKAATAKKAEGQARDLVDRLQSEMDAEMARLRGGAPAGSRWHVPASEA